MDEIINVAVRVRPCRLSDENIIEVAESANNLKVMEKITSVSGSQQIKDHNFGFDHVFNDHTTNKQIFSEQIKTNLDNCFKSVNFCLMCYGQTGSGKTHTILGSGKHRKFGVLSHTQQGIVQLSANYLYKSAVTRDMKLRLSCVEIYSNKIYDIFNETRKIRVFNHHGKFKMPRLSYLEPKSSRDIIEIIETATIIRRSGTSSENERSSRSHAIINIDIVNSRNKIVATSTFIDLAGNERANQALGCNMRENADINTSLLALKECIRSMCNNVRHKTKSIPPFRNSALTKVIRKMFIHEGRALLIATLSPEDANRSDTMDTLRYAHSVKFITKPTQITVSSQVSTISRSGLLIEETESKIKPMRPLLPPPFRPKTSNHLVRKLAKIASIIPQSAHYFTSYQTTGDKSDHRKFFDTLLLHHNLLKEIIDETSNVDRDDLIN